MKKTILVLGLSALCWQGLAQTPNLQPTKEEIALFPNPSKQQDVVKITFKGYEPYKIFQIRIVDTQGKIVYYDDIQSTCTEIYINELRTKGMFLVQILDENNNFIAIKRLTVI